MVRPRSRTFTNAEYGPQLESQAILKRNHPIPSARADNLKPFMGVQQHPFMAEQLNCEEPAQNLLFLYTLPIRPSLPIHPWSFSQVVMFIQLQASLPEWRGQAEIEYQICPYLEQSLTDQDSL